MALKKHFEPVYPSFTSAMESLDRDTSCLPAYRSTHLARYHPYPRVRRSLDFYQPRNTYVDRQRVVGGSDLACEAAAQGDGDTSTNYDVEALHVALGPNGQVGERGWRRINFVTLVIDLALAVQRTYHRMKADI